jgi:hypothetical protein
MGRCLDFTELAEIQIGIDSYGDSDSYSDTGTGTGTNTDTDTDTDKNRY